ncbi:MAG TPA: hypothetical protein VK731_06440 [Candidatus Cybelea sp.]|nr:hypothetical protein [Candidatus Cybelea sp.]
MNTNRISQMELGLGAKLRRRARQARRQRAQWWFSQMRRAVGEANEWRPTPSARPAQGCLDIAGREF